MRNIITQKESINGFVKEGTDWSGRRIPKRIVQSSLELETLFKGIDEVFIGDSFSDYPPSYSLSLKIKNNGEKKEWRTIKDDYSNICEVFPQRNGYSIRDYRLLKDDNEISVFPFCNKEFDSLKEMINYLFNSDFSISVFTQMDLTKVESSSKIPQKERTREHIEKLSKETFDFDRDELKERLIMRLDGVDDKINDVLKENKIETIKN